jgi:hypothetical protein
MVEAAEAEGVVLALEDTSSNSSRPLPKKARKKLPAIFFYGFF